MQGRIPDALYRNWLCLVTAVRVLVCLEAQTEETLASARLDMSSFVAGYEEHYYAYSVNRLKLTRATVHYLLHLPQQLQDIGGAWASHQFFTEGKLMWAKDRSHGRRRPGQTLALSSWLAERNHVLRAADPELFDIAAVRTRPPACTHLPARLLVHALRLWCAVRGAVEERARSAHADAPAATPGCGWWARRWRPQRRLGDGGGTLRTAPPYRA